MKNGTRIHRPAIALLVSFAFLSGCDKQGPSSSAPTAPAAGASSASADQRLNQLEHELQQLQDQNKQLAQQIKDEKSSAPQSSATESAPAPGSQASAPPSAESSPPPGPQPAPETDAEQPKFFHGWIARIMPVGADGREVPSDELGHFVATKDSYKFRDFTKEAGIRSGSDVGWKGEAFLEVTERGRYTFSINLDAGSESLGWCWSSLELEGHSIAKGQNLIQPNEVKSVVGGDELVPGRYRVEFWVACGNHNDEGNVTTTGDNAPFTASVMKIAFEVMVKRPSDSAPVSAARVFVVKEAPSPPAKKSAEPRRRTR